MGQIRALVTELQTPQRIFIGHARACVGEHHVLPQARDDARAQRMALSPIWYVPDHAEFRNPCCCGTGTSGGLIGASVVHDDDFPAPAEFVDQEIVGIPDVLLDLAFLVEGRDDDRQLHLVPRPCSAWFLT